MKLLRKSIKNGGISRENSNKFEKLKINKFVVSSNLFIFYKKINVAQSFNLYLIMWKKIKGMEEILA